MLKIKVTINDNADHLDILIPSDIKCSKKYSFYINTKLNECDYWFIIGRGQKIYEKVCVPPDNVIFVASEPTNVYEYSDKYLRQFGVVLSFIENHGCKKSLKSNPMLPWHIGRVTDSNTSQYHKDYDQIMQSEPKKSKLISVITSNKAVSVEHRNRIDFVMKLKKHFKDRIDLYGRGFNYIDDICDAISSYKYHVVIENSSSNNYWTEKLADAYLMRAFPIYHGCQNLEQYFDRNSYSMIDINNYRLKILNKYNMFSMMVDFCENNIIRKNKEIVRINNDLLYLDKSKVTYLLKKLVKK